MTILLRMVVDCWLIAISIHHLISPKVLWKSLFYVTLIRTISHHDPRPQLGGALPSLLDPWMLLIGQILRHPEELLLREIMDPSRARVRPKNVDVVHSCSLPHVREEDPFCLPFPCFHGRLELRTGKCFKERLHSRFLF
jgi:hypothetical protein